MTAEVAIGDLVTDRDTWDPTSEGEGEFSYIDLGSVDKDRKEIAAVQSIPCAEAPSRARQLVQRGDVLVATVRPNLNGVARVLEPHDGMTASTGFTVLRPKADVLDSGFLFHWVRSQTFIERMVAVATGASYPAVSDTKVKASTMPLPPLKEQRRISRMLDTADVVRAKRHESLKQLDALVQSVFLDMFGDPVKNPKGWKEVEFGECLSGGMRNGLSPSKSGDVPGEVLTLSAITQGPFDFSERKEALFDRSPAPEQMLSKDTFLICRGNGNLGLVGAGVFPDRDSTEVCFPDTIIGARVDTGRVRPGYLVNVWGTQAVRRQLEKAARTTNGTHKINQSVLGSVRIPLPPGELQAKFQERTRIIAKQRLSMVRHLAELDRLFESLQSRAFSGDL